MAKLAECCESRVEDGEGATQAVTAGPAEGSLGDALESLRMRQFVRRLSARDAALWSDEPGEQREIGNRLGWLDAPREFLTRIEEIREFADSVRPPEFRHVVLLGMGGSSECARACSRIFGGREGRPEILVLDDTAPAAVREVEEQVDLESTLFLVASKSGTTVETLSFYRYFWDRVAHGVDGAPGDRFAAVTDPDTPLAREARDEGFRRIFENPEDVGGRYSALTYFGLVPMALLGIDLEAVLLSAREMLRRSEGPVPPADNPAVRLGTALGLLARSGRDKVTLVLSDPVSPFGGWLRQLLAESTGKDGRGLVPVLGEPLGDPESYGDDRLFVHLRIVGSEDLDVSRRIEGLERRGHPVVRIQLADATELGGEFVRWEIATATAGAVLGVNPFDEPNVAEAKRNTTKILEGGSPGTRPVARGERVSVHAPRGFGSDGGAPEEAAPRLESFLELVEEEGYLALLPYLRSTREREEALRGLRDHLKERVGVATCLQHGPRYLHSTGQLHKGGPPNGAFLLLTSDEGEDLPVPGRPFTFGELQRAQAAGDLRALADRGRPVLRIDLGEDPDAGLRELYSVVVDASGERAGEAPPRPATPSPR